MVSLPLPGAWIEIVSLFELRYASGGRSLYRERGLKFSAGIRPHTVEGRSLYRERGLKFGHSDIRITLNTVAPFTGSVD